MYHKESVPASAIHRSSIKTSGFEIIKYASRGRRPYRKIGHDRAVHHVDVNAVCSIAFSFGYLIAQTDEISGDD
jgi:hypothetical protein